ncbi:C45 family autoproteolytic acyltransferase/hydolase [Kordiimonas pumila]|uniref:C45 family autoproteolytic acyltransferase/hydrolase n=1 Tax=Kordiimonas pumila TaxID=2161677 RepID=A0ABV7D401_9PROT|nr:C45 family peptidase [Kordiimonas pumila]
MTTPFPLIDVSGSPFECGEQHGRLAGERIVRGLQLYQADFERRGISWADALLAAKHYEPVIAAYSDDLWQEIRGIAAGSEQPTEAILLLNARTELAFSKKDTASLDVDGCTAILALPEATAAGNLLHGQSWDWRPDCAHTSIVLRITPKTGPRMLLFCEAGQLARHGMNSAGLALTANGLQSNHDTTSNGIPTPFTRRKMFTQDNYSAAIGILLNSKRSFSHNIIISHREGEAICLETTPKSAFWIEPQKGILSHANHFKHPTALLSVEDLSLARHPESLHRDGRARRQLEAANGKITAETFKTILADKFDSPNAICRTPAYRADGAYSCTVANLIMDTTAGKMWLAPAPYDGAVYTEYSL